MTDTPASSVAAPPAALTTSTAPTDEASLRLAIVAQLQAALTTLTNGTTLFPKALPADLAQLQVTLQQRIKNLPI